MESTLYAVKQYQRLSLVTFPYLSTIKLNGSLKSRNSAVKG